MARDPETIRRVLDPNFSADEGEFPDLKLDYLVLGIRPDGSQPILRWNTSRRLIKME